MNIAIDLKTKPLIVLTGPTAVGKTDLSIRLAREIGGEIISADSAQVYKGLNIGSAKIMPDEMQGVRHHMIDVYEPGEHFDVTIFQRNAKRLVEEIYSRGNIPIVVGGTGFYIQSLLYDISFSTEVEDRSYREELEQYINETGDISKLYEELRAVDPEYAAEIHPNNHRKVIRALEYYHFHRKPLSQHNREERQKKSAYNSRYFVLTMNRDTLYARINKRVDIMKESGLLEEVSRLRDMGIPRNSTAMQAIGYKELYDALDEIENKGYPTSSPEWKELIDLAYNNIKINTRHFAKRQLTWFRREKDVIWLDRDSFSNNYKLSSDETDSRILEYIIRNITEGYIDG